MDPRDDGQDASMPRWEIDRSRDRPPNQTLFLKSSGNGIFGRQGALEVARIGLVATVVVGRLCGKGGYLICYRNYYVVQCITLFIYNYIIFLPAENVLSTLSASVVGGKN
jgi:hypothetical protein